ncbi:endolysin [Lactiplantibacillus plantarum subsp. plantarum]|uniref:GH25 family lysozyme n=1 Tax=Lactiplantibacillus plantarum TaxID=1590 RepID=UPI000CD3327D|nr:GH25 family lysozyme [Lactiplantibacillus plantarum]AUV72149.1 endolysin [Lactiplantibacillus plantarum subsp. plantarum]
MKFKSKAVLIGVAFLAAFSFAVTAPASAATHDQGVDWAKFQGNTGKLGYSTDKFAIAQIGGTYGGTLIDQSTYTSQVASAKQHGLRVHSYLWYGVGQSLINAKAGLDYYLPKIQTPKGSIVALDYEDGASTNVEGNTDAVIYGLQRVQAAGYTPLLYTGKLYANTHLNVARILKAFPKCLWIAAYRDYLVTPVPDYNWFPSMDGIAMWQFTSTYQSGGLDGNVDLTGVTKNGYGNQPVKPTPQPKPNNSAKWVKEKKTYTLKTAVKLHTGASTSSSVITTLPAGTTVKTDQAIIQGGYRWVRQPRFNGYGYLATGPASNTLEYVETSISHTYYTVKSGDSWWSIAQRNGLSIYTLATQNGKSIYSTIYPGTKLIIK